MVTERDSTFKVCCQRGNSLLALESFAQKWMTTPLTADRAKEALENHNREFNESSDFWAADRTDKTFRCKTQVAAPRTSKITQTGVNSDWGQDW